MNYTKHTLQKIEHVFEAIGYQIRYEKGSFQSGYALVDNRKIIVINKFFEVEGRINTLIDIADKIEVDVALLGEKEQKIWRDIQKKSQSKAE